MALVLLARAVAVVTGFAHLAFYAGWPKAMSAMTVVKQVFAGHRDQ